MQKPGLFWRSVNPHDSLQAESMMTTLPRALAEGRGKPLPWQSRNANVSQKRVETRLSRRPQPQGWVGRTGEAEVRNVASFAEGGQTPFCWIQVLTQQKTRGQLYQDREAAAVWTTGRAHCHRACALPPRVRSALSQGRARRIGPAPRGGVLSLQSVEVEEGRRQADGQVGGGHLVLLDGRGDIAQEVEERLQDLPVLVGQEHDGGLDRLETLVLGHICATPALPPLAQWFSMYVCKETSPKQISTPKTSAQHWTSTCRKCTWG